MAKDEFDRKELKEADQFFETVGVANRYLHEHGTTVAVAAGGVVAAFFLAVGVSSYMASQRSGAAAEFARAMTNLEFESGSAARLGFDRLSGRSGSGPYGDLATLYSAQLATEAGDHQAALEAFDAFLAAAPSDYLEQAALVGKAFAAEGTGDSTSALTAYKKAGEIDGPYTKQALESTARVAVAVGDRATGVSALEKLLTLDVGGLDKDAVSRKIDDLKS